MKNLRTAALCVSTSLYSLSSVAQTGDIPIIAMTADAFEEEQKQMLKAGMNDHLEKPINPSKVYETLYKWINRR